MSIKQILSIAFWATFYLLLVINALLIFERIIAIERLDATNKMLNTTMERLLDK